MHIPQLVGLNLGKNILTLGCWMMRPGIKTKHCGFIFVYSFVQRIFVENLLCAGHCTKCWTCRMSQTSQVPTLMELEGIRSEHKETEEYNASKEGYGL